MHRVVLLIAMLFLWYGLPLRVVEQGAKPPIESGRDAQAVITACGFAR